MKNYNSYCNESVFGELRRAATAAARFGARTLRNLSWPALLLGCLILALIITILPLALFLFVVFLLCKLVLASICRTGTNARHHPRDGHAS